MSKPSRHGKSATSPPGGFALVVTLSLMILLTVIAMGLLTLSSVSLRTSSQAQAQAQANARLALMLALGELQQSLGPDQNITAPSAIFDTDPDTAVDEGLNQRHLTGVWQARGETLSQTPDYSRSSSFRRWLVSNSNDAQLKLPDFVLNGSLTNPVPLHVPRQNAQTSINKKFHRAAGGISGAGKAGSICEVEIPTRRFHGLEAVSTRAGLVAVDARRRSGESRCASRMRCARIPLLAAACSIQSKRKKQVNDPPRHPHPRRSDLREKARTPHPAPAAPRLAAGLRSSSLRKKLHFSAPPPEDFRPWLEMQGA